ncbi:transposase [Rickettsia endosymbiont of Urophora cardui]
MCKICEHIEDRYEIRFLEIGVDKDHVHFLLHRSFALSKVANQLKAI